MCVVAIARQVLLQEAVLADRPPKNERHAWQRYDDCEPRPQCEPADDEQNDGREIARRAHDSVGAVGHNVMAPVALDAKHRGSKAVHLRGPQQEAKGAREQGKSHTLQPDRYGVGPMKSAAIETGDRPMAEYPQDDEHEAQVEPPAAWPQALLCERWIDENQRGSRHSREYC